MNTLRMPAILMNPAMPPLELGIWPFDDCGPWWTDVTPWILIVGSFGIGIAVGALVL